MGTPKVPDSDRSACHAFAVLRDPEATPAPTTPPGSARTQPPPQPGLDPFDSRVTAMLAANGRHIRLTALHALHQKAGHTLIGRTAHKTWRAYQFGRPWLHHLDPRGPDAMVRLR